MRYFGPVMPSETQSADIPTSDPEIEFAPEAGAIDWTEVFGRSAPLTVEIGTGNGIYLAWIAERHPEINFVGIERAREFFSKTRKRVMRCGLGNARCIRADAAEVFEAAIAPGSVREVIANFSDPWPKRRHRARRVFGAEFLELLERAIEPGGAIRFKTDVGWYLNLTVTALRGRQGWRIVEAGPVPAPDVEAGEIATNFERRAREADIEIWGLRAVWNGGETP